MRVQLLQYEWCDLVSNWGDLRVGEISHKRNPQLVRNGQPLERPHQANSGLILYLRVSERQNKFRKAPEVRM